MTNVPDEIRIIWTDLYKFFDTHYLMGNTEEAWKQFWDEARGLWTKHAEHRIITDGIMMVAEVISDRMKQEYKAKEGL